MSNTKDTGFLRNLISYDASGNITLPANLTVTGSLLANGGGSYATQSYVTTQISNLVNAAPGALDTLNELAAALGNDANFSTTVTNSIATKLALSGGTLTGALNGTSASFSSTVLGSSYVQGGYLIGSGSVGLVLLTSADWGASSSVKASSTINGANFGPYLSFNNPADKGFTFTVNNSSVATISSTGGATFLNNVGIGTVSPSYRLHVVSSNYQVQVEPTTAASMALLKPAAAIDGVNAFTVGVELSSLNTANFRYTYKGYSSTSNYVGIGFWGNDDILNVVGTGRVGIGTTTPIDKLDVVGEVVFGALTEKVSIGTASLAWNRKVATGLIYDSGKHAYQFQHTGSTTNTSDYLALQVYSPTGGQVTSIGLVVNGVGNVGIGTNAPTGSLHIYASETAFRVQSSTGGNMQFGQWDTVNNRIEGSGGRPMLITSYSQPIKLGIDGSENIRIGTNGNLGVGTTTTSWKLSVANEMVVGAHGGSDYTYISGGSGYGSVIRNYYANGTINNEFRGNGNNYVNLGYGSFGIGTSNPVAKLHVSGGKIIHTSDDGGYGQFQINASTTSTEATILLSNGGSGVNNGNYTNVGVVGMGAYGNARDTLVIGTGYNTGTMFMKNGTTTFSGNVINSSNYKGLTFVQLTSCIGWSTSVTGNTQTTISTTGLGLPSGVKAISVVGWYHVRNYGAAAGQGDHATAWFGISNDQTPFPWAGTNGGYPYDSNTFTRADYGSFVMEHDGDASIASGSSGGPHYYGSWHNGIINVNANGTIYCNLASGYSGGTHYMALYIQGYWI